MNEAVVIPAFTTGQNRGELFFGKTNGSVFWPTDFDRIPIFAQNFLLQNSECADYLIDGRRLKLIQSNFLKEVVLKLCRTKQMWGFAQLSGHGKAIS